MGKTAFPEDPRSQLPNYTNDRNLAKIYFKENYQRQWQYEAFTGWTMKPFQGRTITIDSKGDRFNKANIYAKHSNKSVYFFGGSSMWGEGVPDQDTIPAIFTSISRIVSYNKGMTGYTSRQSLERFINLISQKEKISVAIFYDGVNDVHTHCISYLDVNKDSQTDFIRYQLEKIEAQQPLEEFLEYLNYVFLFGTEKLAAKINSKLLNNQIDVFKEKNLSKQLSIGKTYICDNSKERAQRVAETLVNNWEIAHDLAEARGIKFLAILQPVAFIGKPKLEHLQKTFNNKKIQEIGLQYKTVYPLIKKIIRERGHEWIVDYTDIFSRDEYIYIDYAHVSRNGNLIVAKELYKDFRNRKMFDK